MSDDLRELVEVEIARLCHALDVGRLPCAVAMQRALLLGAELERLAAMRRACEEYDRAHAERVAAFREERSSSKPPKS
jgi:hypothetical protein